MIGQLHRVSAFKMPERGKVLRMTRPDLLEQATTKAKSLSAIQISGVQVAGWGLGALMSLVLIAIMLGGHFRGLLDAIGLEWLNHETTGIYADCSKAYNADNPYCSGKREDRGWRNLKDNKGSPSGFALH
jgi:hypothetical protein